MSRKIRSDAVLLNLPDNRQEQIIEWCEAKKTGDCIGGFAFAREQLAADGINVSARALSDFYSDWHLRRDILQSKSVEAAVLAADPKDVQRARMAGEAMLLKLSLAKQDPKLFTAAGMSIDSRRNLDLKEESGKTKARQKDRQLAQKDTDLKLAERRLALLEKKVSDATETLGNGKLSIEERERKIKEIFGVK